MGRLHYAARRGRLDLLDEALRAGDPPDERSRRGETPLHLAAREGFGRLVDRLLAAGADPNAVDLRGTTPLHLAAAAGRLAVVVRLLDLGVDVDPRDRSGETPTLKAARLGRREIVLLLLERGADPLVRERGDRSVEEWLAVGGLPGLHDNSARTDLERPAKDARMVRTMMAKAPTVEEYAAHHGRRTYIFSYGAYDLPDPEADAWAKRYTEILRSPELLAECEERHLTGERLDQARRDRVRSDRSRARWQDRQARIRQEREAKL